MRNRFSYPVNITVDEGGFFLVQFPDLQGTATDGKTRYEALGGAVDCLDEALATRMKHGEDIPLPSKKSLYMIAPSALMTAKIALYLAWKETGLSCLALSKKMGMPLTTLQRMLNPKHRTHIGSIEDVLRTLGTRLVVGVEKAA